MPVWLRLKRASFLGRRRYTNNCMILVSALSVSLYPEPVEVPLSVAYLLFPVSVSNNIAPSFLASNGSVLPGINALRLCNLPSLPKFPTFSSSLIHITAYYYITLLFACNMPRVVSFSVKTSALVIALVLVPIVVLCCCLAVAIACSEYWSSRSSRCSCCPRIRSRWFRALKGRKRKHSDPTSPSSTETPGFSATPSVYGDPVLAKEQV